MSENKILVVDDEEAIQDMFRQVFTKAGYVVYLAESAEKAIEILRQESIMVIFLDLKLPEMNGVDLCKKIRLDNQIGIIYALTGYVDLFGLLECRTAGFDDIFTKPASTELLLEVTQEAFNKIERWKLCDLILD
ncbi:MAG: response regulator [Desulfobacterales bacterium]|nr:response regulator [Desulfobacterales bacterium]